MSTKRVLLLLATMLLVSSCQTADPALTTAPTGMTYSCDNGRTVHATYPDIERALITLDGKPTRLTIALSASGARYTGSQCQRLTKGMHSGMLAPHKPGETIGSVSGTNCHPR